MKKLIFSGSQKVNEDFPKVTWFWTTIFSANWEAVNIASIFSCTGQIFSCKSRGKIEKRKTACKVWCNYFFLKTWPLEDTKPPKKVKFLEKNFLRFFSAFRNNFMQITRTIEMRAMQVTLHWCKLANLTVQRAYYRRICQFPVWKRCKVNAECLFV